MTDQTARHTARAQEEASLAPAAASEQAATPKPSTALEREHAETKDRLLRALAEMENLRKRTDREIAESRLYSLTSFARDLLVVADNMRRALDAITPELRSNAEGGVKTFIEGVELTELVPIIERLERNPNGPRIEEYDRTLPELTGYARTLVSDGTAAHLRTLSLETATGAVWDALPPVPG